MQGFSRAVSREPLTEHLNAFTFSNQTPEPQQALGMQEAGTVTQWWPRRCHVAQAICLGMAHVVRHSLGNKLIHGPLQILPPQG